MVKSKILSKYSNLIHFFGDKNSSFEFENIIMPEQIHGNKVTIIKNDKEKFIKGCDGLFTNKKLLFGIRTADCLPILFYDPKKQIIAAVHAGWKGLYKGIIRNAIYSMVQLGSSSKDLKVVIGPHIGVCCYNVPEERIQKLSMTNTCDRLHLSSNDPYSELRLNSWYLDLGKIALFQLKSAGISNTNIELSEICSSCNRNYWSFRRDGEKAGRMINIIGMIKHNHAIA